MTSVNHHVFIGLFAIILWPSKHTYPKSSQFEQLWKEADFYNFQSYLHLKLLIFYFDFSAGSNLAFVSRSIFVSSYQGDHQSYFQASFISMWFWLQKYHNTAAHTHRSPIKQPIYNQEVRLFEYKYVGSSSLSFRYRQWLLTAGFSANFSMPQAQIDKNYWNLKRQLFC